MKRFDLDPMAPIFSLVWRCGRTIVGVLSNCFMRWTGYVCAPPCGLACVVVWKDDRVDHRWCAFGLLHEMDGFCVRTSVWARLFGFVEVGDVF